VHLPLSIARLFRYFFSIITLKQGTEQEEEGRSGKGTTHKRATAGKTGEEGKEGDRKKTDDLAKPLTFAFFFV
jgi:hypothetical protein